MTLSDLAKYSTTQSARGLSAIAELLVLITYVLLNSMRVLAYMCRHVCGT